MRILHEIRHVLAIIHEMIRVSMRNRRVLRSCSPYLVGGKYKCTLPGDYIFEKNNQSSLGIATFSSVRKEQRMAITLLDSIIKSHTYRVPASEQNKFKGKELIISSTGTEVKIFAADVGSVLTLYQDKEKLAAIVREKAFYGKYFRVPKTLSTSDNYIIEEFIPHECFDVVELFPLLCDDICNYIEHNKDNIVFDPERDRQRVNSFSESMGESSILKDLIALPRLKVHGDMWSSNIIFNGGKYYLTDFERSGVRYSLFDFFCFMWSEYHLKNDDRLLQAYFKGDYDDYVRRMAESLGFPFLESSRELYLLAFLVEISTERWVSKEIIHRNAQKTIRTFVAKY